jgi:hypothetical protein
MVEEGKGSPGGTADGTECLLASRDADGTVRSIGPFARERAEALAQVYGHMYPNQTCWVEPLPEAVQALHTGRVQRHRHLPVLASIDRDH